MFRTQNFTAFVGIRLSDCLVPRLSQPAIANKTQKFITNKREIFEGLGEPQKAN